MNNAILMSAGADIDIMVHGLFSYEVFGQTCLRRPMYAY